VEPLIEALKINSLVKSIHKTARIAAAEALGKLGDRRAVEPFQTLLKDEDADVRQAASEALTRLGWKP
jgi:HEAT repeat protein